MRDVYRANVGGIKKASEAQKLFDLLQDYGFGEVTQERNDPKAKHATYFNVR